MIGEIREKRKTNDTTQKTCYGCVGKSWNPLLGLAPALNITYEKLYPEKKYMELLNLKQSLTIKALWNSLYHHERCQKKQTKKHGNLKNKNTASLSLI